MFVFTLKVTKSDGSRKSDDSGRDSDENTSESRKSATDENHMKVSIYGHVHKNMPRMAGNLKWASELTERITIPVDLVDQLDLP